VIIGEIVRQEDAALAASHRESIMPEYLFFHDLSGQGVLSWKEYHEIRLQIPYRLVAERLFDEIAGEDGRKEPSSFIWGLVPS